MYYRYFLPLILCLAIFSINQAEAQTWSTLGDFPSLSAPAEGTPSLTSGFLQPNVWINPPIVDTVEIEDADTFVFDTHDAASYYAPFQFDTAVATATGWYRYHVREPYHNGIRTDSLFVWFLSIPTPPGPVIPGDTTLPQSPVPSPASAADIVNLVVLDDHDLTRFKILNLADFERAEATLFDRSGRAIYHSKDYRNDFDFANRTPDTYYYIVALHRGGTVTRQKGFVEVVERK